jgi:hypothetical protein
MNDKTNIHELIPRIEREYYTTNGVSIEMLNLIAKDCIVSIKQMPALTDDVISEYEHLLNGYESNDFAHVLINNISNKLKSLGYGYADIRKLLLKVCMQATTYHRENIEILFVFVDAVLNDRYDNYTKDDLINDILIDACKTCAFMDKLNGIKLNCSEILLFVIKLALVVLLVALVIKMVVSYNSYCTLRNHARTVHERFNVAKHSGQIVYVDDM